jgi:cell division protein FtsL
MSLQERLESPVSGGSSLRIARRGSRNLIKRSSSRRLAPLTIMVGLCALAIVFGILLEQVVLAQSAFKLARVRKKVVEAEANHQELLLEAAKLESSYRIEKFAREELGMVEPAPGQVEYLIADVVGRRGPGGVAADRGGSSGGPGGAAAGALEAGDAP